MATAMRMRIGELQEKELRRERERGTSREGPKKTSSKQRELQFSRHLFLCHATRFAVIIRPKAEGAREIEAKDPKYTEREREKGRKRGSVRGSRANRARILRGAQCGVSGPSNACKQSQKTTMMMERGTRERLTDRETVRMRMRIRRRRRHGNNIASPLSLSVSLCLAVCGGRTACNGNGNKNNNKNRNECECEYQQGSQTE